MYKFKNNYNQVAKFEISWKKCIQRHQSKSQDKITFGMFGGVQEITGEERAEIYGENYKIVMLSDREYRVFPVQNFKRRLRKYEINRFDGISEIFSK